MIKKFMHVHGIVWHALKDPLVYWIVGSLTAYVLLDLFCWK